MKSFQRRLALTLTLALAVFCVFPSTAFPMRNAAVVPFSTAVFALAFGVLTASILQKPEHTAKQDAPLAKLIFEHELLMRRNLHAFEGSAEFFSVQKTRDTFQHP